MKTINLILISIVTILTLSCEKETKIPENYSSYLSLSITNGEKIGVDNDSAFQIYIKNDSDKEFIQECLLTFSLYDPATENYYNSHEDISSELKPELPNGILSIGKQETIFQNKNLNELKWSGKNFNDIETGEYIFEVHLFIKDPYSPMNIVRSNRLRIKK